MPGNVINSRAALAGILNLKFLFRTVYEHVLHLFRKVFIGRVQREFIFFGKGFEDRMGKALVVVRALPAHNLNAAFVKTLFLVRDHKIFVEFHLISETETFRAGAKGIVEGEGSGLNLFNAYAAVRTGKTLRKTHLLRSDYIDDHEAFRKFQRVFYGIRKSLFDSFLNNKAVDNDLYVMLYVFIQLDLFRKFIAVSVRDNTDIAAFLCFLEKLFMGSFSATDNRRQNLDLCSFRKGHNLVHHLVHGLL